MTTDEQQRLLALAEGKAVGMKCHVCKGTRLFPGPYLCMTCHGTGRIRTTPDGPVEEAMARLRANHDAALALAGENDDARIVVVQALEAERAAHQATQSRFDDFVALARMTDEETKRQLREWDEANTHVYQQLAKALREKAVARLRDAYVWATSTHEGVHPLVQALKAERAAHAETEHKFAWCRQEIARLWRETGHEQGCNHVQTVVSSVVAQVKEAIAARDALRAAHEETKRQLAEAQDTLVHSGCRTYLATLTKERDQALREKGEAVVEVERLRTDRANYIAIMEAAEQRASEAEAARDAAQAEAADAINHEVDLKDHIETLRKALLRAESDLDELARNLGRVDEFADTLAMIAKALVTIPTSGLPIPMVLHCPACLMQHIDAPEPEKGWTNPPHKSHLCHGCGHVWRPCDRATTGVAAIITKGSADAPPTSGIVDKVRAHIRGLDQTIQDYFASPTDIGKDIVEEALTDLYAVLPSVRPRG